MNTLAMEAAQSGGLCVQPGMVDFLVAIDALAIGSGVEPGKGGLHLAQFLQVTRELCLVEIGDLIRNHCLPAIHAGNRDVIRNIRARTRGVSMNFGGQGSAAFVYLTLQLVQLLLVQSHDEPPLRHCRLSFDFQWHQHPGFPPSGLSRSGAPMRNLVHQRPR